MKSLIILIIVLLVLDIIWIKNVMGPRYQNIFNDLLKNGIKLNAFAAIFAYTIMVFGLYYFVLERSNNSQDALIKGALLGLVMYGVYDGTLYAFIPIKDYMTGFLDVVWGIFVCGFSAFVAYEFGKK